MKKIALLFSLALLLFSCKSEPNYTVIVSLDAFRWDYPTMFDTPWLDSIAKEGVSATMRPSYPSSTFPNHYTLATGLVPDHHGIVNSQFWDSERSVMYSMGDSAIRSKAYYYAGEPIWVTAEKQGVLTGNVYWVGSDIFIKDCYPTYYRYWYDEPRLSYPDRVQDVLRLLALPQEKRPHLVMCYFDDPDWVSHGTGPASVESASMVHYLDSLMGVLYQGIRAFPYGDKVNLIITADHGMTDISDERFYCVSDYVKPEWVERVVSSNPTSIFSRPGCQDSVIAALSGLEHISVWRKEEVPAHLCYGSSDRIGDIVVAPDKGWQFAGSPRNLKGAHGYDPEEPDMQVVFRAAGPDFKKGYVKSEVFPNVDVYSLLAKLLKVKPESTDGSLCDVEDLLR